MRIPSGKVDQLIFFVALDATDLKTRKTGLTTFTVYRSRNGGTATVYTTPTVAELSASNMPGVYSLTIDEDTTIASTSDSEEYCVHITQASMAPVTRTIELYRRDTTSGNTSLVDSNGRVDVIKIAGTTQTARDIGASVLLSTGTGTGQLDFTSGVVKANLAQILGTALTETAGLLAGGFKKFFNVASPVHTIASIDQTGDSYARLGAPAGASHAADVAAVKTDTAAIKTQTDKMAFTVTNQIDANVLDWKSATAPAMTGDAYARLGAPAGASVSADVAAVKVDTAATRTAVGTAGAGLTALGDARIARLDADISTRLATSGYTAPPAAATIAQAVWDALTSALTTVGSIGKLLVTDIDATISSRSTYAGGDTSGTTTLLSRLTSTRAGLLDNLDAAISTRLATSGYTAPDNSTIATIAGDTSDIRSVTDTLVLTGGKLWVLDENGNALPHADGIADAVWEEALADHSGTSGSTAAALAAAGSSGDPWSTLLPGSYTSGQAGKIVGDALDAKLSDITAKTDSLSFTVSGQIDANIQYVNDVQVSGNGSDGTPWGPA